MRGYFGNEFPFADFCGNKIKEIAVSNDGESTLRFLLEVWPEGEEYRYVTTDGDCCSRSWWADIIGAQSAYGGEVINIKSLDLPQDEQERSRQEVDKVYGFQIDTNKGSITLAYRTSSNGYYGGWASDCEEKWLPLYLEEHSWTVINSNDWRA